MTQEILDSTFDDRAWLPARRRRMLLVAYIDFVLFSAPWERLYRVNRTAALVGVPYNLVQLTSAVLSWHLWDAWVAEMVLRRRDYQEIPIRDGEIERMQELTPEIAVASLAVSIVLLFFAVPRLRHAA